MKKEEILDQMDNSREAMLVLLEPLPDEALLKSGVLGNWSIADILVHLTAWESEMVTGLLRVDQGKKPERLLAAFADVEGFNNRCIADNSCRDLDLIFADWHNVRLQLEDWLESFGERQLNDPERYGWAQNKALGQYIIENSFEHEIEHLAAVEAFSTRWQTTRRE